MNNSEKTLKLLQNQDFSNKEKPPIIKRAKRLRNLSDGERLISRVTAEFIKGKITAEDAKNINSLIQGFVTVRRQALEEKELFDFIDVRYELLLWDTLQMLDSFIMVIQKEFKIEPEEMSKVSDSYKDQLEIKMKKREQKVREIVATIEDETSFKIKLAKESEPAEIRKLILVALRKLREADRYQLIDDIKQNFYDGE